MGDRERSSIEQNIGFDWFKELVGVFKNNINTTIPETGRSCRLACLCRPSTWGLKGTVV